MATLNKERLFNDVIHAGEYGNQGSLVRTVEAQTLANGDILHVARIPAYTDLHDLTLFNDAAGGTAAVKVGYVPVDAANGAGDDDFFITSANVAAAARTRADGVLPPVKLDYEVDIIITATAAFSQAADLTVLLNYEWRGN